MIVTASQPLLKAIPGPNRTEVRFPFPEPSLLVASVDVNTTLDDCAALGLVTDAANAPAN